MFAKRRTVVLHTWAYIGVLHQLVPRTLWTASRQAECGNSERNQDESHRDMHWGVVSSHRIYNLQRLNNSIICHVSIPSVDHVCESFC